MSDLGTRAADTALRLLNKYGTDATFTRAGAKTYDPATSAYTETGPETFDIKTYGADFQARVNRNGADIQTGDKEFLIAAEGFGATPKIGDIINYLGLDYRVVPVQLGGLEVQTVVPQNTKALYKVHARRN